jgi:nucleotide-binding universal stress UspA family protein
VTESARTVVVGYDGSPTARAAVTHAVALARGGRVVVVHAVRDQPPRLTSRWRELLAAESPERGQAVLDAILLEGNDELADGNWETRLVDGPAAEAIMRVADEVGAELVVTGSHGHGAVGAVLGSVSQALVKIADRPVTVIGPRCAERWAAEGGARTPSPG